MTYVQTIPPMARDEFEEKLVTRWGETVDKTTAGEMLSLDRRTVGTYVNAGYLKTTPNGRIIVREAARWITSNQRTPKQKKRLRTL